MEDAIALYHSDSNPSFVELFRDYTPDEVQTERDERLFEAGAASAMTLLASIEASFRIDYLQRCQKRGRDGLSRAFRRIYRTKETHVSLDDDLLDTWIEHSDVRRELVREIRSAFRYRHWLAHGRYWNPKLGRQYDFASIYGLASDIDQAFPLLSS